MYHSIDTNIVLGILNPHDRLHEIAISLINKIEDKWVICHEVLAEAKETLKKKINETFCKITSILVEIYKNTYDLNDIIEIKTKLMEAFKKLEEENPRLKNIYKLLYKKIDEYLSEKGRLDIDIFSYLSELGENMSRVVESELKKYIQYKKLWLDLEKERHREIFKEIKTIIAEIRFKDSTDENIFFELMVNLEDYNPIKFYTDDKEFIKKGRKAYELLSTKSFFNPDWFLMEKVV